jgi:hypothetical protein
MCRNARAGVARIGRRIIIANKWKIIIGSSFI